MANNIQYLAGDNINFNNVKKTDGLPVVGGDVVTSSATIASGASLSGAVSLASGKLAGVQLPSNIDSATSLTFQVSYDGGSTYANFYADGSEYTLTVAASQSVRVPLADFLGATHIKVRLGTSGTPVTTAADRTLTLALVP